MQRSRKRIHRSRIERFLRRLTGRLPRRRPSVYKRGVRRRRKGRGVRIVWQRFVPFVFFVVMGVTALSLLINYGVNSLKRKSANEQLAREYSGSVMQTEEAAPTDTAAALPVVRTTPQPMLREKYRILSGEPIERLQSLYQRNNDLVGWLYIRGVADLPVVYRNNEYYLNHNFYKQRDAGGTLFLDEYHPLTEITQHLVIHGHNMYDSSMFGILSSYTHLAAVKANAFASFSTMYNQEEYVVFAVLQVDPQPGGERYFNYIGKPTFLSEEDFYSYTAEMKERSLFSIPIDILPADSMMTLATCVDNDRLAVVYRKLREGETREQLQLLIDQAYAKRSGA